LGRENFRVFAGVFRAGWLIGALWALANGAIGPNNPPEHFMGANMAEQPSLHIDTDWKTQAQEEKRKLAEQEKKRAAEGAPAAASAGKAPAGRRGARELPPASFSTLVQSLMTQALFYLGDLSMQGAEPTINLDMAKHQLDTLAVLEEKTKNNLAPEEQRLLDGGLYEVRMRYVAVASEYL
jgi:hypothetical protein